MTDGSSNPQVVRSFDNAGDLPLSSGMEVIPGLIEHLSASSISKYLRCPRRFWYEKVMKVRVPRDGGQVAGSAAHAAIEASLQYHISQKEWPSVQFVTDLARDFSVQLAEDEDVDREDRGRITDKSVRLSRTWQTEVAPTLKPAFVEKRWEMDIDDVRVVGVFDEVEENGEINDWKTKQKAPAADTGFKSVQTELYRKASGGFPVNYVYLIDYARKGVQVQVERIDDPKLDLLVMETVRDVAKAIRRGVFPRNRDGWMCSARWCPHYGRCITNYDPMNP